MDREIFFRDPEDARFVWESFYCYESKSLSVVVYLNDIGNRREKMPSDGC